MFDDNLYVFGFYVNKFDHLVILLLIVLLVVYFYTLYLLIQPTNVKGHDPN